MPHPLDGDALDHLTVAYARSTSTGPAGSRR